MKLAVNFKIVLQDLPFDDTKEEWTAELGMSFLHKLFVLFGGNLSLSIKGK